ncbi:hypothetical protein [Saccharopolyspora spinosa]|uniref:SnoaL-like protein n=1 Tax=Saccharopolyspora spinosa TaxID=60894 RepID=A0A2N3Y1K5_SACSN|nr:hypothetical protein [Saccharopolyspora spinosa]PKW16785.1 hypothetical protein A8926_4669 [Saccharopolyspora spinosa]
MLARCFTADARSGRFVPGERPSGVLAKIRSRHCPGRTHLTANLLLEPALGSTVHGRATFAVIGTDAVAGAYGEYDDMLVRDSRGEWVFASRQIVYRSVRQEGKQ